MKKKTKKCMGLLLISIMFFGIAHQVWAQNFQYNLMVPLPQPGGNVATTTTGIADYIRTLYLFALLLGGVLAFGVLVFAGFLWLTSGGVGQISRAKSMIRNALLGIALLATSYIILNTINPELVRLQQRQVLPTNIPQRTTRAMATATSGCALVRSKGYCGAYAEQLGEFFFTSDRNRWRDMCNNDGCNIGKNCEWHQGFPWGPILFGSKSLLGIDCKEKPSAGPGGPSCLGLSKLVCLGTSGCCWVDCNPPGPSGKDYCSFPPCPSFSIPCP